VIICALSDASDAMGTVLTNVIICVLSDASDAMGTVLTNDVIICALSDASDAMGTVLTNVIICVLSDASDATDTVLTNDVIICEVSANEDQCKRGSALSASAFLCTGRVCVGQMMAWMSTCVVQCQFGIYLHLNCVSVGSYSDFLCNDASLT
jgi:hypothetical protein